MVKELPPGFWVIDGIVIETCEGQVTAVSDAVDVRKATDSQRREYLRDRDTTAHFSEP